MNTINVVCENCNFSFLAKTDNLEKFCDKLLGFGFVRRWASEGQSIRTPFCKACFDEVLKP
jgi:hypothetical protein